MYTKYITGMAHLEVIHTSRSPIQEYKNLKRKLYSCNASLKSRLKTTLNKTIPDVIVSDFYPSLGHPVYVTFMVVIQVCFHYHSVKLKVQFTHNHNLHLKLIQVHISILINIIIKKF